MTNSLTSDVHIKEVLGFTGVKVLAWGDGCHILTSKHIWKWAQSTSWLPGIWNLRAALGQDLAAKMILWKHNFEYIIFYYLGVFNHFPIVGHWGSFIQQVFYFFLYYKSLLNINLWLYLRPILILLKLERKNTYS